MNLAKLYKKLSDIKAVCEKKGIELSNVHVEVSVPSEGDPEGCLTGTDLLLCPSMSRLEIYPVCGWKEED